MENTNEKKTPLQVVTIAFCMIIFCGAFLFGALLLTDVLPEKDYGMLINVFWIAILLSQLLIACSNWNKQKALSTVLIGLWSFLLGGFVIMLLFQIIK